MPAASCPVCGDGALSAADYFGPADLTDDGEHAGDAGALGARRDEVVARLLVVAGLAARIPNTRWRHRTGLAAHVASYTRTIARLDSRRLRLLGWTWREVGFELPPTTAERARELFGAIDIRPRREHCRTCGSRRWPGPVTDGVPHAVLAPALRRHATAEVPAWVPLDDEPQCSFVSVVRWAHQVGGNGGVRNLLYATDRLLREAVTRDCWDGDDDGTLSAALGATVDTSAGFVNVQGALDF